MSRQDEAAADSLCLEPQTLLVHSWSLWATCADFKLFVCTDFPRQKITFKCNSLVSLTGWQELCITPAPVAHHLENLSFATDKEIRLLSLKKSKRKSCHHCYC